jgi:hypothetical protein
MKKRSSWQRQTEPFCRASKQLFPSHTSAETCRENVEIIPETEYNAGNHDFTMNRTLKAVTTAATQVINT